MHRLRNASLSLLAVALTAAVVADAASARGGHSSRGRKATAVLRTEPVQNPVQNQEKQATTEAVSTASQPAAGPAGATPTHDPSTNASGHLSEAALSAINLTSQLPSPPSAPAAAPTAAISAPADQVTAVAPLSSPVTTTILTAGGAVRVDSSSPTSTSPTEAAPSIAGGGGVSLTDCMGFWDAATHMTKAEWKAACVRSLHRLDEVSRELATTTPREKR
jgi:hypothetical protein